MNVFIKIYEYFQKHRKYLWCGLGVISAVFIFLASWLKYDENIFDFLPEDKEYAESINIFSTLSESQRIVMIFEGSNPDTITNAIDEVGEYLPDAVTELDIDNFLERLQFVYEHMPYFLDDSDYAALNDKLNVDNIQQKLVSDKQIITTPGTSFLMPSIANDPLQLVPISKIAFGQYAVAQSSFASYDGYMMTSDYKMGFAFYDTPYGSMESSQNELLVDSLENICAKISEQHPSVSVRLLGAPVISVANARCIKHDSILAVLLSLLLIIALLLYAFPVKRDILLILFSIAFGWLGGMAVLAVVFDKVSVIVLGIGAVLIGISVNYPLHLLVHQRYTTSIRQTLQEVIAPLTIGNVTTIAAFMALIPLKSSALCQLGVFAAADLACTILFCILFLPHFMQMHNTAIREIHLPLSNKWRKYISFHVTSVAIVVTLIIAALIVVLRPYNLFDANISHINYMTEQQKEDLAFFEKFNASSHQTMYTVEEARDELNHRVEAWNKFWQSQNIEAISDDIFIQAETIGINPDLLQPFISRISTAYEPVDLCSTDTLAALWPGRFNTLAMNTKISNLLSDNFDYVTMVCSCIVLLFLCLSFKSILVGLIAFLPMVLSWILIIALMQIFGLQFNIVNVILATFIFGQGDDYTIFVVEGILYEKITGKPMLKQYKQSIILSAVIMLVAIGMLVISRHPAMHSLGAVVLIGMSAVVLMAYFIPPILFYMCEKIPLVNHQLQKYYSRTK